MKNLLIAACLILTAHCASKKTNLSPEEVLFMQTVHLRPTIENNEIIGMKAISIDTKNKLFEYNVQNNDVLIKINSTRINTTNNLLSMIKTLGRKGTTVTVLRNDKEVTLKKQ